MSAGSGQILISDEGPNPMRSLRVSHAALSRTDMRGRALRTSIFFHEACEGSVEECRKNAIKNTTRIPQNATRLPRTILSFRKSMKQLKEMPHQGNHKSSGDILQESARQIESYIGDT